MPGRKPKGHRARNRDQYREQAAPPAVEEAEPEPKPKPTRAKKPGAAKQKAWEALKDDIDDVQESAGKMEKALDAEKVKK